MALRTAFLKALRRRRPLKFLPEYPDAEAVVLAAVSSDATRLGYEPAALVERFIELRTPEAIEAEIKGYGWELETVEYQNDPDADDVPPFALASLAPMDGALAAAFMDMVRGHHPPPAPPANEAEGLLRRWGEGDEIAAAAAELEPAQLRWLIERLARYTNLDHAWHQLFALARTCPGERPRIEAALESWADGARLMPRAWFAEMEAGHFDPVHRLVRELMLSEEDWSLLLQPGVEESLGGLSGLGLQLPGDAMTRVLARGCNLPNLRTLHCQGTVWDEEFSQAIATTDSWPGLETLALRNNVMRAEDLAALWAGGSFPTLTRLEVFNATDAGSTSASPLRLKELAAALKGRSLARRGFSVRMTGMDIDVAGLRAFVSEPAARGLVGLSIIGSELNAPEIAVLAEAPLSLQSLTLHAGAIGPEGGRALANAPWRTGLRELSVFNQHIGDDAMAELLASLSDAPVRRLVLLHNQLGPKTAAVLSESHWPELEVLELSHNGLTDEDIADVLSNPSFQSLVRLEALATGAAEATARALTRTCFPSLHTVNLGDAVGGPAASILEEGMHDEAWAPRLKRLQLRGVEDTAMRGLHRDGVYVTNAMFA